MTRKIKEAHYGNRKWEIGKTNVPSVKNGVSYKVHKFGANAQPYYVIINSDGEPLAAPYGYNESVAKFIDFLQKGPKSI